jgi:LysM repeat protein
MQMSPLPAALPPFDVPAPTGTHAAVSTGPAVSAATLATERSWTTYTVRPGDTLYDIAERHGTTVQALVARNSLAQGGRWLMPGQKVSVPGASSSSSSEGSGTRRGSESSSARQTATVTVRPGDTLSHIAARHGVTVGELARANGISNPRLIFPGQRITVPGSGTSSSESSSASSKPSTGTTRSSARSTTKGSGAIVTVRPGDTLSHIAARHDVALDTLLAANPDVDPRRLWVGQKVVVPGSSSSGSSSSAQSPAAQRPWTQDTIGDTKEGEKVEDTFLHYTYSSAVARSAAANREYLADVPVPSAAETKALITETARRHGVDPKLMLALAYQESGWNQRAVSPANALGVMQVIPASGEWASGLIGRDLNLLDPQDNVTAGVVIMRALLRSAGSEAEAIGGYYQGLASVNKHGLFADTTHYVRSIRALRDRM